MDLRSSDSLSGDTWPQLVSTIDETQTQKPGSLLLGSYEEIQTSPSPELEDHPLFFDSDHSRESESAEYHPASNHNDPEWLSEFDPEFIDSLRGCVNFVD